MNFDEENTTIVRTSFFGESGLGQETKGTEIQHSEHSQKVGRKFQNKLEVAFWFE